MDLQTGLTATQLDCITRLKAARARIDEAAKRRAQRIESDHNSSAADDMQAALLQVIDAARPLPELPPPAPRPKPLWFSIVDAEGVKRPSVSLIMDVCGKHFGVTRADLESVRRQAKLVHARQVAMYLCRLMTVRTFPEIGRHFGGRDHTTALHAADKIARLMKTDIDVSAEVVFLKDKIEALL